MGGKPRINQRVRAEAWKRAALETYNADERDCGNLDCEHPMCSGMAEARRAIKAALKLEGEP